MCVRPRTHTHTSPQVAPPSLSDGVAHPRLNLGALEGWLSAHQEGIQRLVELQQQLKADAQLALSLTDARQPSGSLTAMSDV